MRGAHNDPQTLPEGPARNWRRRMFWIWIAASIVVALTAMVGGPLVSADGSDGTAWIALLSPVAMAVFILTGVTWLVLVFFSQRPPR